MKYLQFLLKKRGPLDAWLTEAVARQNADIAAEIFSQKNNSCITTKKLIRILIFISFMASVSSIAMWFSKNGGNIEIVWLGWQVNTSISFFLLTCFYFFLSFNFIFAFKKNYLFPFKIKNIKRYQIRNAEIALEEGLLASTYEEKGKVLKSYNKAKKYLKILLYFFY